MKVIIFIGLFLSTTLAAMPDESVVTAEKFIEHRRKNGQFQKFIPPKIVLICYQQSVLTHLLKEIPAIKPSEELAGFNFDPDGQVGILGGWGFGAPALAVWMEQLIALGVEKFVAVGTAGSLMKRHSIGEFVMAPQALAEDGVAHLYLKGDLFSQAHEEMCSKWHAYAKRRSLPYFHSATAWSYSALFRETPSAISRALEKGCDIVEMETATFYAIGREKEVETLSLFVISDVLTDEEWVPHIIAPSVRTNLHKLAICALEFCQEEVVKK